MSLPPVDFTSARDHAQFSSELLQAVARAEEKVSNLTEDEHLRMVVTNGIRRHNEDMKYTIALAQAHATVALALTSTEIV